MLRQLPNLITAGRIALVVPLAWLIAVAVGAGFRVREGVQHSFDDAGLAPNIVRRPQVARREQPPYLDTVAHREGRTHGSKSFRCSISASFWPNSSGVNTPFC